MYFRNHQLQYLLTQPQPPTSLSPRVPRSDVRDLRPLRKVCLPPPGLSPSPAPNIRWITQCYFPLPCLSYRRQSIVPETPAHSLLPLSSQRSRGLPSHSTPLPTLYLAGFTWPFGLLGTLPQLHCPWSLSLVLWGHTLHKTWTGKVGPAFSARQGAPKGRVGIISGTVPRASNGEDTRNYLSGETGCVAAGPRTQVPSKAQWDLSLKKPPGPLGSCPSSQAGLGSRHTYEGSGRPL